VHAPILSHANFDSILIYDDIITTIIVNLAIIIIVRCRLDIIKLLKWLLIIVLTFSIIIPILALLAILDKDAPIKSAQFATDFFNIFHCSGNCIINTMVASLIVFTVSVSIAFVSNKQNKK
jgi:hypothetical protein